MMARPYFLTDVDGVSVPPPGRGLRSGLLWRTAFRLLTGNASPAFDPAKMWDVANVMRLLSTTDRRARILDCGGFNSPSLRALSRAGFRRLYGIDLNTCLAAQAAPWRTRLTVQDMQATAFSSRSFDVVLSCSTIEHGVSWPRFIAEAARVLTPGGLLYLSTDLVHDQSDPSTVTAFGLPWQPLRARDLAGAIRLLGDGGFEVPDPPHLRLPARLPHDFFGVPLAFVALVAVRRP